MTCGRSVFRGSGAPVSSARMVISEGSVPFWASAVSGRKQVRGEGLAGVGGQRPGSYPLGGGAGEEPRPRGAAAPPGRGRGGGCCPPPAVYLQQLLSCWAGDRGGWRTGRRVRVEDAA